jgi:DNA polymerase-3 subunit alpha
MYVSLHNHTYFSVLDGLIDPIDLAERTKAWGMPAVALTDHGNLSGIPDFYNACKNAGVKPILGMEAYMVPDRHARQTFRSPTGKEVRTGYHLLLLAKNVQGYRNLIALNNIANLEGFYYSPKIDWEVLTRHREGLIVSSACVGGEVGQLCLSPQNPKATVAKFKELWGDDYYLELMENGMGEDVQRTINKRLLGVSKSMGIKLIPTNDAHYMNAEEQRMHDMAICMRSKKLLSDPKRMKYDGLYHLKHVAEMAKLFGEFMPNTLEVAEKVESFDIYDKNMKLPMIVSEPDKVLKMMAFAGLDALGLQSQVYVDRLNFELDVISRKGFSSYMLTIKEVIDLIHTHGCPIGWGRGSAGGSLICYSLGITSVDPIKYGLLFERFISEFRPDWPDIDIDISRDKRDEIINKIVTKYGNDKVAHISTFHYMKPKILIRDICRVAEKPVALADALSKMVPRDAEVIEDLKDTGMEEQLSKNADGKAIWAALHGLLGIPRHVGMHASGIVISSAQIKEHLPLRRDTEKNVIQYSMEHMDGFGFLKFDLLGLETLDLVFETAAEIGIDIKQIPLDDQKTYQMVGEGKVAGMFQLDKSKTCIDICRRMKPKSIQDLADIIALNRPGVLDAGLLEVYLRRRDGTEKANYIHPDLQAILEPSFGVCIYQEDLMRMAAIYAGYTPLEVENLRKGIGKKDASIIQKHIPIFREKALALGRNPQEIETVLEQVEAAGRYSFNKSHAVAYAMLTYACGYLAANYPLQFFKNVINHSAESERTDYLSEVLMRKFTILPPDINKSSKAMTVEGDAIRMGLLFIKGVGDVGANKIMEGRPYVSMQEVTKKLTKTVVTLLHSTHALSSVPDSASYQGIGRADEVALLGVPLHGLMAEFKDVVNFVQGTSIADIQESGTCVIKLSDIHKHKDKNKKWMAFCEGFDVHGPKVRPLIMFASIYDTYGKDLKVGETYGMVISRLNNGGFSIKGLRKVEEIRALIASKGA